MIAGSTSTNLDHVAERRELPPCCYKPKVQSLDLNIWHNLPEELKEKNFSKLNPKHISKKKSFEIETNCLNRIPT